MRFSPAAARKVLAGAAAVAVAGLGASSVAFAATSSPPARAATAIPRCTADPSGLGLGVWVAASQGDGAAGTIYYPLEFTNFSGHACYLHGFPGVSALDRDGKQLGSPARWESFTPPGPARTVILNPGATAHAMLAYHDAVIFNSPGCHGVSTSSELRVYPPDERTATDALFDFQVCTHPGPIYLSVGAIQPGVGGSAGNG
ncbi:MAG: DUF4232 domain-containing protein [Streptosporangiaceae bacterium]|nr:DUF4232 domain-containing protein [Streptosporangiaceae bacterium]